MLYRVSFKAISPTSSFTARSCSHWKKKKKKIPTFYAAQMLKFSLAFHVCCIKPCFFCVWVLLLLLFSCTNQNHINIFETKHSPHKWLLFQATFPPGTSQHTLPNPGASWFFFPMTVPGAAQDPPLPPRVCSVPGSAHLLQPLPSTAPELLWGSGKNSLFSQKNVFSSPEASERQEQGKPENSHTTAD